MAPAAVPSLEKRPVDFWVERRRHRAYAGDMGRIVVPLPLMVRLKADPAYVRSGFSRTILALALATLSALVVACSSPPPPSASASAPEVAGGISKVEAQVRGIT